MFGGGSSSLFGKTPQTTSGTGLFGSNQQQNTFGTSQQSNLFGNPQSNPFGTNQQNTFGNLQPSTFGNQQSSLFGNQQPQSAFGTQQPQSAFGTQPAQSLFGTQSTFGAQQPQSTFGAQQPQSTFGAQRSAFGTQQPLSTFGAQQPQSTFGNQQTSAFGTNTIPSTTFGTAQSGSLFGNQTTTGSNVFGGGGTDLFGTTTNTATGGLFGTQQPAAKSLFGTQQTKAAPLGSSFWGSTNLGSNVNTTPSFGSTTNNSLLTAKSTAPALNTLATTQQPVSGLFGQSTTPATQVPNTNLFRATTTPATGGLFGNTAGATTTITPAIGSAFNQPGSSLLGSSSLFNQSQAKQPATLGTTGGLFGASTTASTFPSATTQPLTSSLFNTSNSTSLFNKPPETKPLFGGTSNLFGTNASTAPLSIPSLGTNAFATSISQPQSNWLSNTQKPTIGSTQTLDFSQKIQHAGDVPPQVQAVLADLNNADARSCQILTDTFLRLQKLALEPPVLIAFTVEVDPNPQSLIQRKSALENQINALNSADVATSYEKVKNKIPNPEKYAIVPIQGLENMVQRTEIQEKHLAQIKEELSRLKERQTALRNHIEVRALKRYIDISKRQKQLTTTLMLTVGTVEKYALHNSLAQIDLTFYKKMHADLTNVLTAFQESSAGANSLTKVAADLERAKDALKAPSSNIPQLSEHDLKLVLPIVQKISKLIKSLELAFCLDKLKVQKLVELVEDYNTKKETRL